MCRVETSCWIVLRTTSLADSILHAQPTLPGHSQDMVMMMWVLCQLAFLLCLLLLLQKVFSVTLKARDAVM